ncbi:MAG TPA: CPBP family intramembrane glutamic endopeptidase [Chloroflexota bacterium]
MRILELVRRHPVVTYFVLAYWIAWGGIAVAMSTLAESGIPLLLLLFVPIAAGPTSASLIMTGVVDGKRGYRDLFSRLTRWRVAGRWYTAALLINPLVILLVLGALSLLSAAFVPGILVTTDPAGKVGLAIAGGLAAGVFEEIGWTGFATPRLLKTRSVLSTGLLLGVLWSAWHIGGDIPGSATWGSLLPLRVLLWMFAGMTAYRVLMTWVYSHSRSLLVAILMHAAFTGGQVLLEPIRATQVESLVWWGLLAVGLWVVVGIVLVAERAHPLARFTPQPASAPMASTP